eukprot:2718510-Pleurochrysis_carterae.AAC.1
MPSPERSGRSPNERERIGEGGIALAGESARMKAETATERRALPRARGLAGERRAGGGGS